MPYSALFTALTSRLPTHLKYVQPLGRCFSHHVLALGQDVEDGVVPLLDMDVQEAGRGEGAAAGGAHVTVQRVVVVLVLLHAAEPLAAARDVTAELGHTARGRGTQ